MKGNKIFLLFVFLFSLPIYASHVSVRAYSHTHEASGPWKRRTKFWYDVTVLRTRGENVIHDIQFMELDIERQNNDPSWPETRFNFTTKLVTPPGVNMDIIDYEFSYHQTVRLLDYSYSGEAGSGTLFGSFWGRGAMRTKRRLNIPASVPDMMGEALIWTNPTSNDSQTGVITIQTLPSIEVPDIDFGTVMMGGTEATEVRKSGELRIRDGASNASVNVFFTSPQISLVNPSTSDVINVNLSFLPPITELDNNGEASTTLEASILTNQSVEPGVYVGTVEVQCEYN